MKYPQKDEDALEERAGELHVGLKKVARVRARLEAELLMHARQYGRICWTGKYLGDGGELLSCAGDGNKREEFHLEKMKVLAREMAESSMLIDAKP